VQFNPMSDFVIGPALTDNVFQGGVFPVDRLHPMKGPMLTQNLHSIAHNGPLHWRGDRIGDTSDQTDVRKNLHMFSGAFATLMGLGLVPIRTEPISNGSTTKTRPPKARRVPFSWFFLGHLRLLSVSKSPMMVFRGIGWHF